jgi:hypothetical protein
MPTPFNLSRKNVGKLSSAFACHNLSLETPMNSEVRYPNLGIDIDGCIDESPIFFQFLSDELILVDTFEAKAEVVARENIMIYFDDQPEMIKNMPDKVNVMLVRNGGNFCFDQKLWMMSNRTGRII